MKQSGPSLAGVAPDHRQIMVRMAGENFRTMSVSPLASVVTGYCEQREGQRDVNEDTCCLIYRGEKDVACCLVVVEINIVEVIHQPIFGSFLTSENGLATKFDAATTRQGL